jgi:hypothetical protein
LGGHTTVIRAIKVQEVKRVQQASFQFGQSPTSAWFGMPLRAGAAAKGEPAIYELR